jgi:hypothetical protein
MNAMRTALAALVLGLTLQAHDSEAVLLLANDTDEVEWRIGEPAPSINQAPYEFLAMACGAELSWVYENFPTLPKRMLGATQPTRRAVAGAPGEFECVIWRGDNARFIADNITVTFE